MCKIENGPRTQFQGRQPFDQPNLARRVQIWAVTAHAGRISATEAEVLLVPKFLVIARRIAARGAPHTTCSTEARADTALWRRIVSILHCDREAERTTAAVIVFIAFIHLIPLIRAASGVPNLKSM